MMEVAILGCGYVGLSLGQELRGAGHDVVGVRRSEAGLAAVEEAGIRPVEGDVTDPGSLDTLPAVDAVVFAASSGGGDAEAARGVYVDGLSSTIDLIAGWDDPPAQLLYTSSTGVYGDHGGDWVDEQSELRPASGKAAVLVEAEEVARGAAEHGIEPTVARLGGIYGPGRLRVERYLERPVTEGYLNLLHRADAGGALAHLLAVDAPETVLVADDEPVWKPDLSRWLAEQCGVDPPPTRSLDERLDDEGLSPGAKRRLRGQKRCSNGRLRSLGYDFTYPTYREGYRAAVERYLAD